LGQNPLARPAVAEQTSPDQTNALANQTWRLFGQISTRTLDMT